MTKPLSIPPYRHSKLRVQERLILYFRTTSNIRLWTPPWEGGVYLCEPAVLQVYIAAKGMTRLAIYWGCSSRAVTVWKGHDRPAGAHLSPVAHPEAFRIACSHTLWSAHHMCPWLILPKLMRTSLCPREVIHCPATRKRPIRTDSNYSG